MRTRTIKFRYWNDVTKQMVNNPSMPYKEGWTIEQLFSDRGWVWMQFTGLLDRHGVEIYEGDILRNTTIKPQLVEIYATDDIIGAFGWGFKFRRLPNDPDMTWRMEMDKVEVIGNIYETPELLTNKGER